MTGNHQPPSSGKMMPVCLRCAIQRLVAAFKRCLDFAWRATHRDRRSLSLRFSPLNYRESDAILVFVHKKTSDNKGLRQASDWESCYSFISKHE